MTERRRSMLLLIAAAALTALVDLVSKVAVTSGLIFVEAGVIYNPSTSHLSTRLVICVGTFAVVTGLAHAASRRGIERIRLVWIACGILIGAVVAQGISTVIWSRGVPDFIWLNKWVWNLADFSIGIGLFTLLASSIWYAGHAYLTTRG